MDTSIWATWYDVQDSDAEEHDHWLHREYLPLLKTRPGYAWVAHYRNRGYSIPELKTYIKSRELAPSDDASLGRGSQHIVMVGATSPMALLKPSAWDLERAATDRNGDMLGRRVGVRTCLLYEFVRVNGPEIGQRPLGTTPAPVIQFGTLRAKNATHAHEICKWYATLRLPDIARTPGCVSARQLLCAHGWPQFGILYEFVSLEAHHEHFETRLERTGMDESWTRGIVDQLTHAPGSPSVAVRMWPPAQVDLGPRD